MRKGKNKQRVMARRASMPAKQDVREINELAVATPSVKRIVAATKFENQNIAKREERTIERVKTERKAFRDHLDDTLTVEALGGVVAHGWHEGVNYLLRWYGETEPEGSIAKNIDLVQSIPASLASLGWIITKALEPRYHPEDSKKKEEERRPYLSPMWRESLLEACKVASHLGLSNLFRALRYRYWESLDEKKTKAQALADKDDEVAKMQVDLEAATKEAAELKLSLQKAQADLAAKAKSEPDAKAKPATGGK